MKFLFVCFAGSRFGVSSMACPGHTPGYVKLLLPPRQSRGNSHIISDKRPWSLEQLQSMPQTSYVARHVCVEGWSMIGKWGGVPLKTLFEGVGADLRAKYVAFRCDDPINYCQQHRHGLGAAPADDPLPHLRGPPDRAKIRRPN